jgi:lysyl-tRNA synthetase class 2
MTAAISQLLRQKLKEAVRGFFSLRSYQEVDTPVAVVCPGTEVHLQYFRTAWQTFRGDREPLYLRSSPELHMKQLLAEGMPRIFQFATCFRNHGELADWHHPEFTMLEWYETVISYDDFITQTGDLIRHCAAFMRPWIEQTGYQPAAIPANFDRFTVAEAFREFAGLELTDRDPDLGAKAAAQGVLSVGADDDFETAFFKVLLDRIEPALERLPGAVLCDYPPSQAALAVEEDGVARRFEYYLGRTELSNGFKELLGEQANRQRVRSAMRSRSGLGHDIPPEDEDFYRAMARGVPPCCGNALGFDRLLAILCGQHTIAPFIPFRTAAVWQRHAET